MTDDENANIHTVSVSVPDWLKERFGNGRNKETRLLKGKG